MVSAARGDASAANSRCRRSASRWATSDWRIGTSARLRVAAPAPDATSSATSPPMTQHDDQHAEGAHLRRPVADDLEVRSWCPDRDVLGQDPDRRVHGDRRVPDVAGTARPARLDPGARAGSRVGTRPAGPAGRRLPPAVARSRDTYPSRAAEDEPRPESVIRVRAAARSRRPRRAISWADAGCGQRPVDRHVEHDAEDDAARQRGPAAPQRQVDAGRSRGAGARRP